MGESWEREGGEGIEEIVEDNGAGHQDRGRRGWKER